MDVHFVNSAHSAEFNTEFEVPCTIFNDSQCTYWNRNVHNILLYVSRSTFGYSETPDGRLGQITAIFWNGNFCTGGNRSGKVLQGNSLTYRYQVRITGLRKRGRFLRNRKTSEKIMVKSKNGNIKQFDNFYVAYGLFWRNIVKYLGGEIRKGFEKTAIKLRKSTIHSKNYTDILSNFRGEFED